MSTPQYPTPESANFYAAPPLWAPYYGAPFKEAIRRFFTKYATFTGRASRSEYWWWFLVSIIVGVVLQILIAAGSVITTDASGYTTSTPGPMSVVGYVLEGIWFLATIVPQLALLARRLHDVNISAWMIFIGLVPFLGGLTLLILSLLPPKPEGQRFDRPTGPVYPG
ncbi:DUF805 domain-containing protein [Sinomonas sp. G460-2]|uniref:DUF805 domain-containing protein n=1 Tax=Sinomonas sp. G460-2 TaxID=3393464 RepID=UPI0039EE7CCC